MKKIKESHLQKAILDYLRVRGIFCWRNNTGSFYRNKHFYRFGTVGSPDVFAIRSGTFYGIECKAKGNKQSAKQKEFEISLMRSGGMYILARELKDLRNYGL